MITGHGTKKKASFLLHTPNVRSDIYDHLEKKITSVLSKHLKFYMNEMESKSDIQFQLLMERVHLALVESKCMPSEIIRYTPGNLPDIQGEEEPYHWLS